jgi:hypothetical protein
MLQNFSWIASEKPTSYAPNRHFHDDCDADPYVKGRHKMGPTHVKHPGNLSIPHPANDSGSDDEVVILEVYCLSLSPYRLFLVDLRSAGANPQVVEHATPLAAEVGQEFLDNLASRGWKNKAPAPEAGPSGAPPAKRLKKKSGDNPYGRKHRHEMLVAAGQDSGFVKHFSVVAFPPQLFSSNFYIFTSQGAPDSHPERARDEAGSHR